MKKIFLFITIAVVLAVTVLPVFAYPISPDGYLVPSGTNSDTPSSSDWVSVYGSSYALLCLDVNHTPCTYADILAGTEYKIYGKLRGSGVYGYKLYYGTDTTDLVLIHEDNTEGNSWLFTSTALTGVTELEGGCFWVKSFGTSRGQCAITADIVDPAGPVLELSAGVSINGQTGQFYRLSSVDYDDILSGDVSITALADSNVSFIYTNSTTDNLSSFESVGNLNGGVFTLNNSNAPTVTLTGGYLAVYFASDCSFVYRVSSVVIQEAPITVEGFTGFILAPFYAIYTNPELNYFTFAILTLLFLAVVYYIIKIIK